MFGSFGWMELLLILFIVLIIFGAGKIPQLGEGLGKAIKGFKKSVHEPEGAEMSSQASETSDTSSQPAHPLPHEANAQTGQSGNLSTGDQKENKHSDFERVPPHS